MNRVVVVTQLESLHTKVDQIERRSSSNFVVNTTDLSSFLNKKTVQKRKQCNPHVDTHFKFFYNTQFLLITFIWTKPNVKYGTKHAQTYCQPGC